MSPGPPHKPRTRQGRLALSCLGVFLLSASAPRGGSYVTETSGIRWNDVGGIRWNDVGGIRWNDVGGIRWNDVGGIRWNDVGGSLFADASGIRWNDVGGIRWNDVGGLAFDGALTTGLSTIDLELLAILSTLPSTSSVNVIITYRSTPTPSDLADLNSLGIPGGAIFRRLPMVVVNATPDQIRAIAAFSAVRSVFSNRTLSLFDEASHDLIGADEAASDPELLLPGGSPASGSGITIAVLDTGVDGTHPDLPYGSKVVENVKLNGALGAGPGFVHPVPVEGEPNTDLVLGHGTFVASVAAGTGAASGGTYRGVAPGASILALSAGDLFITNVLEGFDYILDKASQFNVRIVNCSWGTQGFFDPDDPVNIATRLLYDSGITVVFAVGNHGPSPDTLNPYSVAPWVIGVGSTRKDGSLSVFSSRGIFEELLYHPILVAPGEGIIAASPWGLNGITGVVGVANPSGGTSVPSQYSAYYSAASGTSFSAPLVAGVVALMLETNPALTPGQIKQILQRTATPILTRDRSDVGAGRLDAWAALTQVHDPARPFGTHIPGWLDARAYRIEHRPPVVTQAFVPAGSSVSLPITLQEAVVSLQLTLAWGTLPGLSDLDLQVTDSSGREMARSESFNGASLFGRTEGVYLLGAVPSEIMAQVFFKGGTGLANQAFQVRQESAIAVITAYGDVATLPLAAQDRVARAVSRHVLEGRGDRYDPYAGLTRGELARSLALTAELPQRVSSAPSFPDIGFTDPDYPFVETVAGSRARQILMGSESGKAFKAKDNVTRLDFAVALVRAAGMEAQAQARSGETLGLTDEASIPPEFRGYVAVALEQELITSLPVIGGNKFDSKGSLLRLDAVQFLLTLLDMRDGPLSP